VNTNLLTIKDIRSYLIKELESLYGEQEANSLTRIIIKTVTGSSGLHQVMNSGEAVPSAKANEMMGICKELMTGKPLQYILGETSFYNCDIRVTPDVLIPRPETEELVDLIIKENKGYSGRIIDFGTGSGCIAIALAKNLKEALVSATDISVAALEMAGKNALLNNVSIDFRKDDVFNPSYDHLGKAGIIVSNPPYVRNSEKILMQRNVLEFEPHKALFVDDNDPLSYYRALTDIAEAVLLNGGKIYFEINEAFGTEIATLLNIHGFSGTEVVKDLNGKERFVKGTKNGS
jgi:release factor glutamine methyltransferase